MAQTERYSDNNNQLKYLKLLSNDYPNRNAAATEIINLQAIINLPKGTEHFISDIHGEHEAFFHVLKNGSGVIKSKIKLIFDKELTSLQMRKLATLIYYPHETIDRNSNREDIDEWFEINLHRLIRLTKEITSKYTRMKLRKALPKEFRYIIEELLHEFEKNNTGYYDEIIKTVIELERSKAFLVALAEVIQWFAVAHLHIIGDIFDRGPGAHIIMDRLEQYHSLDIQWGNHDILWMGAAAGCLSSIANAVRISLRYGNVSTLEEGYGISLRPLSILAYDYYDGDECTQFMPKESLSERIFSDKERDELSKMHKAISIIQFKLESQLILKNPQWNMNDRLILNNINKENKTVTIYGNEFKLKDSFLPTLDISNPFELNDDEKDVIAQLQKSFDKSEKLQRHVKMLFDRGSVYTTYNNNLLYHGCVPMNEVGEFLDVNVDGNNYKGKELLDICDVYARNGYFSKNRDKKGFGESILWWLWSGKNSPLFAKDKMSTFEHYFVEDNRNTLLQEKMNSYYNFRDDDDKCSKILEEFGLNDDLSKIVNGHVPVQVKKGESPLKADGKLLVIDGGFSKAYQNVTGIAGYTLIYNSHGMLLVSHEPFKSADDAITNDSDIVGTFEVINREQNRILVKDTDVGKQISLQITDLKELYQMYREGIIKEIKG